MNTGITGSKGYYLNKTGERVNELLSRLYIVPTFEDIPDENTLTWNDGDYVVNFRIGELIRVKNNDNYIFFRLSNILDNKAKWERLEYVEPYLLNNFYNKTESDNKYQFKGNYLEKDDIDLTGYATEEWVKDLNYLIEHQDISNLATKNELEEAISNIEIPSIENLATKEETAAVKKWVENQNFLTKHLDISHLATKRDLEYVISDIPSIRGLASEEWVKNQNYLTQIPSSYITEIELEERLKTVDVDLSDYYTKEETELKIQESISSIVVPESESIKNVTEEEYNAMLEAGTLFDKTMYFVSKDGSPIALYIGTVQIAVREEGSKGFAYNFPIIF